MPTNRSPARTQPQRNVDTATNSAAPAEGGGPPRNPRRRSPRVADPHFPRRFDTLTSDVDVTAQHGVGRCAPGLEEACCPEPLVDPDLLHRVIFAAHG